MQIVEEECLKKVGSIETAHDMPRTKATTEVDANSSTAKSRQLINSFISTLQY
jgi:hypothetical protein